MGGAAVSSGHERRRSREVAFTSEDRVRDGIRNFNADGLDSLYPKYRGGRPPKFTLPQRREVQEIFKSRPAEHDLPFSTSSLSKLAEFLVSAVGRGQREEGRARPCPAAPDARDLHPDRRGAASVRRL
jgi:hypothetical protein